MTGAKYLQIIKYIYKFLKLFLLSKFAKICYFISLFGRWTSFSNMLDGRRYSLNNYLDSRRSGRSEGFLRQINDLRGSISEYWVKLFQGYFENF